MLFIHENKTKYHILIDKNATESIRIAALSLRELINHCTDAEIEICTERKLPYISIGSTEEFKNMEITTDAVELNDDGFKIVFRNGNIYLCGGTERGTIYAVNAFAERYLGVRFLTEEETYMPHTDNLEIPETDITEVPDFPSRSYFAWEVRTKPRFAAELRLISPLGDDEGAKKYGGGFVRDWNVGDMHAMERIMPKAKYFAVHPEWYASDRPRAWLCLTNGLTDDDEDAHDPDSCLSTFTNNVITMIQENPEAKYIMLGHEDSCGDVYCKCERCQRSRERNVTISGYLMVWINAVARRVEKWRLENCPQREFKLVSFAYLDTIIPPVYVENQDGVKAPYTFQEYKYRTSLESRHRNITPVNPKVVPEKNVIIFCALAGACYLHEMTDDRCDWNNYYRFAIQSWKTLGADIMIWYYGANFKWHLWWFPNRLTMRKHLEFFKQLEPLYVMQQGAPREGMFYQAILNTYLISKLMWHTEQDVDTLTEEFNRLYFGDRSALAVNAFIHKIEAHYKELDSKYDGTYHSDIGKNFENSFLPENFPYDFLTDCIEDLESAIAAEPNEAIKTKLKRVSLHPLYMLAHNFSAYENADTKYLDLLEAYLRDTGLRYTNEANVTPEALMKQLRENL